MPTLELTDRTRDALRRIAADIYADPVRYLRDFGDEIELRPDEKPRGVRVWESIMRHVDPVDGQNPNISTTHVTLDAERMYHLTEDVRRYLEALDADHATERELAVPMHILSVMQVVKPLPKPLESYAPMADMDFMPVASLVERHLNNHSASVADVLFVVLDDRRLHDIFDLSHRDVEKARRAIKRAQHQENSSYAWSLPDGVNEWLHVLVRDVVLTSRVNVRFERYDTDIMRRFVRPRDTKSSEEV